MNRVDIEDLSGADDGGNVEITLRGRCWSNASGFVGKTNVQRIAIDVTVNSDGLDAHLLASPDNATRDLAAIRDQDLLKLARIECHRNTCHKKAQKAQNVFLCLLCSSVCLIVA
jgi:hypothetical protein